MLGSGSVVLGVGGGLALLLAAGGAHAAETGPHFHPVAADIQNLAQDVLLPTISSPAKLAAPPPFLP